MHARDLAAKIGVEPLPHVLLFCPGKAPFNREDYEPFLAERLIERIVSTQVDPSLHDLAYTAFYADEARASEIVMEAQTVPFLAERRVILLRNAERYIKMSGDKRSPVFPLLEYIKSPTDTTLLLMTCATVDRRTKFYTTCKAAGALVECPQLDDRELTQWVQQELRAKGRKMSGSAMSELLGRTGPRLGDINNALTLLITYAGEREEITEKDVLAACADVAEESIWQLTDAIARSQPEKALRSLQQLLEFGKSPDEVIGTVNWLLENAYRASPETSATVQSRFVGDKVLPLAQKLGLQRLKEALALCTRTQFMLRNTGVDRTLALELMVVKLSVPRSRPQAARRA